MDDNYVSKLRGEIKEIHSNSAHLNKKSKLLEYGRVEGIKFAIREYGNKLSKKVK